MESGSTISQQKARRAQRPTLASPKHIKELYTKKNRFTIPPLSGKYLYRLIITMECFCYAIFRI